MATTKKVTKTSKPTITTKTTSKVTKTEPKKSVVISKKVVTGSTNKTAKSIPVNRKVVYVDSSKTTPSTPVKEVAPKPTTTVSKPQINNPTTHQSSNNVPTNNQSQTQQQTTQVNKTYPINNQPQVSKTPPKPNQSNLNQPKPKQKKKKHRWIEAVTAIVMFGTVLGGIGYHVYKLATTEQKKEEYSREIVVKSDNAKASGKQSGDKYEIFLTCTEDEKRVKSVTVKIGGVEVPADKYSFDKSTQKITFDISYLKTIEGTIEVCSETEYIQTIVIDKTSASLEEERDSIILTATLKHIEGTITWKSSNDSVAKVEVSSSDNKKCTVSALKKGSATVTATIGDLKASCSITVKEKLIAATYNYIGFDSSGVRITNPEELKNAAYFEVTCSNIKECQRATIPATYTPEGASKPIPVEGIYEEGFFDKDKTGNSTLIEVEFEQPDNIKRIGDLAFDACYALKTFQELTKLESIGRVAFSNCYELKEFVIPASVVNIGESAFQQIEDAGLIKGLTSLTFKDQEKTTWFLNQTSYKDVKIDIKGKTKEECAKLIATDDEGGYRSYNWVKDHDVKAELGYIGYNDKGDREDYASFEGEIVYYKVYCNNSNEDKKYIKEVTIPAKYKEKPVIGFTYKDSSSAMAVGFALCYTLKKVNFEKPENIKSIDSYSFEYCERLDSIDLSIFKNLEKIDISAFKDCKSLPSQKTPESLKVISSSAFYNCSKMVSFNSDVEGECVIPKNITEIGSSAFVDYDKSDDKCYSRFKSISFESSNLDIDHGAFGYYKADSPIFSVPTESEFSNYYYLKNGNEEDNKYFAFCGFINKPSKEESIEIMVKNGCKLICGFSIEEIIIKSLNIPSSIDRICEKGLYRCRFDSNTTYQDLKFNNTNGWHIVRHINGEYQDITPDPYIPNSGNFESTKTYLISCAPEHTDNYIWTAYKS